MINRLKRIKRCQWLKRLRKARDISRRYNDDPMTLSYLDKMTSHLAGSYTLDELAIKANHWRGVKVFQNENGNDLSQIIVLEFGKPKTYH